MTIPLWVFVPVLTWAVATSVFLLFRNPLPIPDRGHRCFAVPDERAARVVATILGEIGRLPERFTFDVGPIHQTLLWDNTTVLIRFDETFRALGLPGNGLSVPVANPQRSAEQARVILEKGGFSATIATDLPPEMSDKLVILRSNAFDGWVLVFRQHVLSMGKPKTRRLTHA